MADYGININVNSETKGLNATIGAIEKLMQVQNKLSSPNSFNTDGIGKYTRGVINAKNEVSKLVTALKQVSNIKMPQEVIKGLKGLGALGGGTAKGAGATIGAGYVDGIMKYEKASELFLKKLEEQLSEAQSKSEQAQNWLEYSENSLNKQKQNGEKGTKTKEVWAGRKYLTTVISLSFFLCTLYTIF
ncbi:MAG: hypothetical protein LBI63_00100 [Candidatus Ancillula sp.]|jgi:hypothetical protein|nr:hypothetical protein [Candidatus Ancillula sp.]